MEKTKEQKVQDILHNQYYADFETTTEANYKKEGLVRVFMWGLKDSYGNYWTGTTMQEFLDRISVLSRHRSINVWFHNLKFDFSFIEWWILNHKKAMFKHRSKMNRWTTFGKEYTTLRDGMNQLYSVDWYMTKDSKVGFRDSAKLYPMPLGTLGEMVGVPKLTELFDYEKYVPRFYDPTEEEWAYMDNDVEIVKRIVIKQIERSGVVRMTRSGYAFHDLRQTYIEENTPEDWVELKKTLRHPNGKKFKKKDTVFEYHFPPTSPELYEVLKVAYAGGFTQLMPQYKGVVLPSMISYDVNSEYPGVMIQNWFPIFAEESFEGDYHRLPVNTRNERPLFVQRFMSRFKLKKGAFPSLPKKMSMDDKAVYSSKDLKGRGIMTLSNIDLEHFYLNYEIEEITFLGGWHWQAVYSPFKSYIDKVAKEKIEAEEAGDMIGRQIAKLEMNGCYGKFAQNPFKTSKLSYLDDNQVVRFDTFDETPEAANYFPMGIFITAYARDTLFSGIYAAGMERFVYCDTDSIHLLGHEPVNGLDIHESRLGAWKWEEEGKRGQANDYIIKAKYLREKCYAHIHESSPKPSIKAAGLSEQAKGTVKDIDEFNLGQSYTGSFQQYLKKGGALLQNTSKLLKQEAFAPGELEYLERLEYENPDLVIEVKGLMNLSV